MAHTILLVDDDTQLTHVVSMFFELEGFAVQVAKSGEQALELMSQTRPDVVLLDLVMPDMDGVEICRKIRADKRLAKLPVAVFTAVDQRKEELMAAGANTFIAKPYSLDGLKKTVQELLEPHQAAPDPAPAGA